MDIAFRTNITIINQLAGMVPENEVKSIALQRLPFKKKIRSLVIPTDGIIEGDTLKDTYFPSDLFEGSNYDFSYRTHTIMRRKLICLLHG